MKIDVAYVAELARLELTDEEKAVFQPQLENIVKYVEKISEVDVEGVEPMMHGRTLVNAFREDVVRPSLDREAALAAFVSGVDTDRDGKPDSNGVSDILLGLKTYSTSGN